MLDKSAVDQMVRDAQEHAEEDKQRREEVETRNQAEALTFQAERAIKDLGDKVSSEDKAEVENKVESLREALKGSDMEPVKAGMSSLAESLQRVSTAAYQAAASSAGDSDNGSTNGTGDGARLRAPTALARRGRNRRRDGRGRVQGGLGLGTRHKEGPRETAGLSILRSGRRRGPSRPIRAMLRDELPHAGASRRILTDAHRVDTYRSCHRARRPRVRPLTAFDDTHPLTSPRLAPIWQEQDAVSCPRPTRAIVRTSGSVPGVPS